MCSGKEEGNDSVADIILAKLEMITDDGDELNSASFVESSNTEVVVLVEVRVLEGLNVAISIHLLEPLRFLGMNHGVLSEHHEEGTIESREALLSSSLDRGILRLFLVVEVREEDATSLVLFLMVDITEVASWANHVLDELGVDEITDNAVHESAERTAEAVGKIIDTHVRSAD